MDASDDPSAGSKRMADDDDSAGESYEGNDPKKPRLDKDGKPNKADKRAHHNALERKRRDHIKDSFSVLRDSIPALHGEKASRAQILNKATDYIQYMRKKNANHSREMEELKAQNEALDLQRQAMLGGGSAGTN